MKTLLAAMGLLILAGSSAHAQNALRGQWQVRFTPDYIGVMLVDGSGRVTFDSPKDDGRPARFIGYVKAVDDARAHIIDTDQIDVAHTHCSRPSSDILDCRTTRADGSKSGRYLLVRVGPGPDRLHAPIPPSR